MTELDVAIPASYQLRGTLNIPEPAPQPAALLISGSGPLDRNSDMKRLPLGVMREIAEHLGEAGIASLRYDKRGVGASGGEYLATGFRDNIADARAALDVLRNRPEVDAERVFVVGHSEGALIASALSDEPGVAGVVLLAGAARNGKDVLRWQARQVAPTLPMPVRLLLKLLRQDIVRTQSKRLARLEATTEDVVRIQLVKVNARWFREFMVFDPAESLAAATAPVLAITGAKDIQVDPADVAAMERIVPTSFTGHVVENVTHLLRSDAGPATVRTYKKQARRPVDRGVLDLVTGWITTRSRVQNGADHDRV